MLHYLNVQNVVRKSSPLSLSGPQASLDQEEHLYEWLGHPVRK